MPKKVMNQLTAVQVKNATPGRYTDGGGLQLLVKPSGARSWVYRYKVAGKSREIGLGPAGGPGAVTLAAARMKAEDLRRVVAAGGDPIDLRRREAEEAAASIQQAQVANITFRQAAQAYIEAHEEGWKNSKHRQQWRNTLETYAYPVMGDIPVADVGTEHVMAALEKIWKTKPETASRVRGRIERVLDSARARGLRQGENPARWRGHVGEMLPPAKKLSRGHHPAMPYSQVPDFVAKLRLKDAMAAAALEFAILTAARTSEVTGATWDEVDLNTRMWIIPAKRMKKGREHRVPLSDRAISLLEDSKQLGSIYLFPGTKGTRMSNMAMSMLLRRMLPGAKVSVHGFRTSFRGWAAERTSFPWGVCETALSHVTGTKTEVAYFRTDLVEKRRKLMDEWAAFCASPSRPGNNVTPIRTAA